ncbi:MAG: PLP-dependent aminotransferase family protein [Lachnospiraceae bacterium]|nr:PLP-dependent aminotransferase family protein [Lachnospiraceae bacterium]
MNDWIIPLDAESKEPIYKQIYSYIKEEIRSGRIPCKSRLPSTRVLAENMQLSRSTITMAYDQLVAEGYLEAKPCRGHYVAQIEDLYLISPSKKEAEHHSQTAKTHCLYDFSPRGIDLESFPYSLWRKITKNILSEAKKDLFLLGEQKGDYELRKAIQEYLYHARGVNCTPQQLIVGAGNEYLLWLLHQILGKEADLVAMENPTYQQAYRVLQSLGHPICPISMDGSGMLISQLQKTQAKIAYVTPSHQYPLGVIMPIKRRMELLSWAMEAEGRYIIEDDYDSEFRYKGKPIPSLQGVDQAGRVIYIGTFSRSIAPAIRVSYMVLPVSLMERYEQKYGFYSCTVPRVEQAVLTCFLQEGYFERHLNRMRANYKAKHDVMLSEIQKFPGFLVSGEHAGIHLLLTAKEKRQEQELLDRAWQGGVRVYGLSEYYIGEVGKREDTVVLGYANLSEKEILEGLGILRSVWGVCKR